MSQTNRGTGTWSEVVYYLRQQGMACNQRASFAIATDKELAQMLRKHGEAFALTARRLHVAIRTASILDRYDSDVAQQIREAYENAPIDLPVP